MSQVLIAGGGRLGARLGLWLAADGHRVWGLQSQEERLPEPLLPLAGELRPDSDLPDLTALAESGLDLLYLLDPAAGADGSWKLQQALERARLAPRRLLFASDVAVYGCTDGRWVDEATPAGPADDRGRQLVESEELLRASGLPVVVVRFGELYGSGRHRLLDSLRRGEAVCHDHPPRYVHRTHFEDSVGILHHLGVLDDPLPLYLGVDHAPALDGEVKRWLADLLEVPEPPSAPWTPGADGGNVRCSNRLLLDWGYRFLYPDYRAGYGEILDRRRVPRPEA